jgi:hypothetical protein
MTDSGEIDDVGVRRMNLNPADLARVGQTDVRPRFAGVGRFVDAVARGQVAAQAGLAHADVHHVRIRRGDRDRADRAAADESVRHVVPRQPGIVGFPHAAAGGAHVVHERQRRDPGHRRDPAAPERTDVAPSQRGVEIRRLLGRERLKDGDRDDREKKACSLHKRR